MRLMKNIQLKVSDYIWLLPAIMVIAVSFFSYANVDSIRDYTEALRIARGENFPLTGPQMAFTFSVGGWWFYLMSLAVLINNNWLMIAVFTAILSSFKFYIAYRLGLLIANRKLALLMTVSLLLISMNLMQGITFTHTNLVETIMLVIIWVCVKNHENQAFYWALLGGLCGLAFHVHPTAFLVGYFVAIAWFQQIHKVRNMLLFLVGFLLIFIPLIIFELTGNDNLVQGGSLYLEHKTHTPNLPDFFRLMIGFWVVAPFAMLKTIIGETLAWIVMAIQLTVVGIALLAPMWSSSPDKKLMVKWLKQLWLFFILNCIGLLLIRSNTPWYLSYGLGLTSALMVAIGLYLLWQNKFWHFPVKTVIFWFMLVFICVQLKLIYNLKNNQITVPSVILNDIKSQDTSGSQPSYEIVAYQAHQHGKFTCQYGPVSLHGTYAQLIYSHSGMEHHSVCDHDLYYGSTQMKQQILGIPEYFASHVLIPSVNQVGNTVFYQPLAFSDTQKAWKENFTHDYERTLTYKSDWQQPVTTVIQGSQHLIITNILAFKMPWKIIKVTANNKVITPSISNYHSALFVCNQCQESQVHWQVEYQEGVTGMTDIVSF